MPGKEAHPSIPSRGEGKKYRLSNDLFPLPTGGGEGVGDPIQTLPLFQRLYPVRDGYIIVIYDATKATSGAHTVSGAVAWAATD